MSLLEPEKKKDLYINPIFDKMQRYIWTSDICRVKSRAWIVDFCLGGCSLYSLRYGGRCVRAVRSGQSSKE